MAATENFLTALSKRIEWLQWIQSEAPTAYLERDRKLHETLPLYEKVLESGDTFYMNTPFCQLVEHARETIPDDLVWDETWLQSKQGFLWLEKPFAVPPLANEWRGDKFHQDITISAIGWFPIPAGYKTTNSDRQPGRIAEPGAVEVLCFLDFKSVDPKVKGFGCWSFFMLQPKDKLIDRIHQFEYSPANNVGHYDKTRITDMQHEIRWIYAAFHLMSQRLSTTVKHTGNRAMRREMEKERVPFTPFVKLITLRRLQEYKEKFGEAAAIDWHWRWTVRGHWRNQWFRKEQIHKPVFIESYVKGTPDKPMKPPSLNIFKSIR